MALRLLGVVVVAALVAGAVATVVVLLRRPADQVVRGPLTGAGQATTTQSLVTRAQPSVVRVLRGAPPSPGAASPSPGATGGSGVVIDSRGYVLTAEAVIAGADSISVAVPGGKTVPARVVGSDPPDALTLLKVDTADLHPMSIAGASPLDAGAGVVVVSAPPYIQVAVGAVAGAHASTTIPDPSTPSRPRYLNDLLVLDVASRDGQVGAPLLDASGRLAGLVVAGGGQPYAVDMSEAQPLVQQLVDSGHVSYPSLGFEYRQLSATEVGDASVPAGTGVIVESVTPAAAQAGLAVGDVVTSANGTNLDAAHPLARVLRGMAAGQSVNLNVARGGTAHKLTLTLTLVSL